MPPRVPREGTRARLSLGMKLAIAVYVPGPQPSRHAIRRTGHLRQAEERGEREGRRLRTEPP